jgi:DHA1 family inner membrane transport protein
MLTAGWQRSDRRTVAHVLSGKARSDSAMWIGVGLSVTSVATILGMPIIVGALQDRWGYSAAEAGYVSSIDLAGIFAGSALTSGLAARIHWRRYVAVAMMLCILANASCAFTREFATFGALRFVAGLTAGGIYAASLVILSNTRPVARSFSVLIFVQVFANALILLMFPALSDRWGPAGIFVVIAGAFVINLAVVPFVGGRLSAPVHPSSTEHPMTQSNGTLRAMCLGAVALFYVTIGSYWAYCERIGIHVGLRPKTVHELLSAGVLLSLVGCSVAYWLSRRVGQSRPLLAALSAVSLIMLLQAAFLTRSSFVIALAVVQLCWNFVDIFQLGTLALVDPSGRTCALVPAAQGIALAVGPAAGGLILDYGFGYRGVLCLSAFAAALAACAYFVVHRRYRLSAAPISEF